MASMFCASEMNVSSWNALTVRQSPYGTYCSSPESQPARSRPRPRLWHRFRHSRPDRDHSEHLVELTLQWRREAIMQPTLRTRFVNPLYRIMYSIEAPEFGVAPIELLLDTALPRLQESFLVVRRLIG